MGVTIGGGPDWLAPFHHSTRSEVEKREMREFIIVLIFEASANLRCFFFVNLRRFMTIQGGLR